MPTRDELEQTLLLQAFHYYTDAFNAAEAACKRRSSASGGRYDELMEEEVVRAFERYVQKLEGLDFALDLAEGAQGG